MNNIQRLKGELMNNNARLTEKQWADIFWDDEPLEAKYGYIFTDSDEFELAENNHYDDDWILLGQIEISESQAKQILRRAKFLEK